MKTTATTFGRLVFALAFLLGYVSAFASGSSATLNSVQPTSICSGQGSATLLISLQGTAPYTLSYSDGINSSTLSTEQSSLSISVSPSVTSTYSLVSLTDGSGDNGTVSGTATLTVNHSTTITQDLSASTYAACNGEHIIRSIQANGSNVSYQWRLNGQAITNNQSATTNTLDIAAFSTDNVGVYDCVISGDCTSGLMSTAQAIVLADPIQLLTDLDNSAQMACPGSTVSFSVVASGSDLSYQWRINGQNISNNSTAQSSTLVISSASSSDIGVYDCLISSRCDTGGIISSSSSLNLSAILSISNQPISEIACPSGSAEFMVSVSGSDPVYQWRKDGIPITNNITALTAHLVLTNLSSSDAGNYDVVVTNSCQTQGSVSDPSTLSLYPALTINSQPQSSHACLNSNLNFSVDASGFNPSYQWRLNGNPILDNPTATLPTLQLVNVDDNSQGIYDVVVTDICSQWTSAGVELNLATPVGISTQLQSQQVCEGAGVQALVNATGSVTAYQWLKDGTILPGQTSSLLNLTSVALTDNGQYSCLVYGDASCSTTPLSSNDFRLSVLPQLAISTQPHDVYASEGGFVSFFVDAIGVANASDNQPSYQWYRNGVVVTDNQNVHGSNSAQLTIENINAADNGTSYSCMLHGACGNLGSASAAIIIPSLVVTTQVSDQQACSGSSITLTFAAHSDQFSNLQYQWFKDQVQVPGATNSTLTIASLQPSDAGTYFVKVFLDGTMTVNSAQAVVTTLLAPAFDASASLSTQSVCSGSPLSLNSSITAGSQLIYQWTLNGVAINGATDAQYVVSAAASTNAGLYTVAVSNSCSTIQRDVAQVSLLASTAIQTQPVATTTLTEGQNLQLSVQANGDQLKYQWSVNGTDILGATDASYTKTVSLLDAGNYSVMVSGSCGSLSSNAAVVTVNSISAVNNTDQQDGWTLSSAAPNPTSTSSSFSFTTPQASVIHVALTDVQGRNVAVITDAAYEAGTYSLQIDANALQLSNGYYSITLLSSDGHALHQGFVVLR